MDANGVIRLRQQMADCSRDGKSLDRNTIGDLLDAVLDDHMPLADFEDWLAGSASRLPTAEEIIGVVDGNVPICELKSLMNFQNNYFEPWDIRDRHTKYNNVVMIGGEFMRSIDRIIADPMKRGAHSLKH